MVGLSDDVYNRCRNTLLKCGEFDTQASLQAVFVTAELALYRDRLPQTTNKNERVSQTILFLLDQRLSDGPPVFLVFMATLRNNYVLGDALRDELQERLHEVEQKLGDVRFIDIPLVIAAMNQREVNGLITETVFDEPTVAPVELVRFQQFKQALQGYGITDLLPHYEEHREGWKPYTYPCNV